MYQECLKRGRITLVLSDSMRSREVAIKCLTNTSNIVDFSNSTYSFGVEESTYTNFKQGSTVICKLPTLSVLRKKEQKFIALLKDIRKELEETQSTIFLYLTTNVSIARSRNDKIEIYNPIDFPDWLLFHSDQVIYAEGIGNGPEIFIDALKYRKGYTIESHKKKFIIMNKERIEVIYRHFDYADVDFDRLYSLYSDEVSYRKLWNVLKDRDIGNEDFRKMANITNITLGKLATNKLVSINILKKICKCLDCDFGDIIEYTPTTH